LGQIFRGDGGDLLESLNTHDDVPITQVRATSLDDAWAVGLQEIVMLRSRDGWHQLPVSVNGADLWSLLALPDGTALVAGNKSELAQVDRSGGIAPIEFDDALGNQVSNHKLLALAGGGNNPIFGVTEQGELFKVIDSQHAQVTDPAPD